MNPKLSDDDSTGRAVESVLMNSGDGPNSYAANSTLQRNSMMKVKTLLEESVQRVYTKTLLSTNHFAVADLGCATGPNSFKAATTIIEAIFGLCIRKSTPEILVFLNDLPGNDFNSIFTDLSDFYDKLKLKKKKEESDTKCFVSAMPGSFYGRLFPNRSIHFVHSAMSLHWLSQVPNGLEHNNGSIYIASTSSTSVWEAYLKQFQMDFTLFLFSRAQEVISQGEMHLTFICRTRSDARHKESVSQWEMLSNCLLEMAIEGLIKEKDIDSCNMPFYIPHENEVRELVEKEVSFVIDKLETIQENIGPFNEDEEDIRLATAKMLTLGMRAVVEPLLIRHFGVDFMMDDLSKRFEGKLNNSFSLDTPTSWAFLILTATKI